jgi:hypothetical protein
MPTGRISRAQAGSPINDPSGFGGSEMDDGQTRVMQGPDTKKAREEFLSRCRASIVVLSGGAEGDEHILDKERISMGRGPGADLEFPDNCMSRKHAVLELTRDGYRIQDLGSTNGVLVNGSRVQVSGLKHRDRFQIGEHTFQYVLEGRDPTLPTYKLPET